MTRRLFLSPIHYILYIFLRQVNNYHHHNHYILFISLHCDDMDIIAIIYSTISIIFFIIFDDCGSELYKTSLRFQHHPPYSVTITLTSLPYPLCFVHLPSPNQDSPPSQPFWSPSMLNYSLFFTIGTRFPRHFIHRYYDNHFPNLTSISSQYFYACYFDYQSSPHSLYFIHFPS